MIKPSHHPQNSSVLLCGGQSHLVNHWPDAGLCSCTCSRMSRKWNSVARSLWTWHLSLSKLLVTCIPPSVPSSLPLHQIAVKRRHSVLFSPIWLAVRIFRMFVYSQDVNSVTFRSLLNYTLFFGCCLWFFVCFLLILLFFVHFVGHVGGKFCNAFSTHQLNQDVLLPWFSIC